MYLGVEVRRRLLDARFQDDDATIDQVVAASVPQLCIWVQLGHARYHRFHVSVETARAVWIKDQIFRLLEGRLHEFQTQFLRYFWSAGLILARRALVVQVELRKTLTTV